MTRKGLVSLMFGALAAATVAFPPPVAGEEAAGQAVQQMYGYQLMTEQERVEHMARMRAATTAEEREQIRAEQHARMQERAREQGVTLPAEPMPRGGMGMGRGGGGRW